MDRKTVAISEDAYNLLDSSNITKDATETILDAKKKEKWLQEVYAPHLSVHKILDFEYKLVDDHLEKVVTVTYKDNRFWCSEDKPKPCMHVFYVMGHAKTGWLEDPESK